MHYTNILNTDGGFMRFYCGADRLVFAPLFNEGNPSNDYGRGFFLHKKVINC